MKDLKRFISHGAAIVMAWSWFAATDACFAAINVDATTNYAGTAWQALSSYTVDFSSFDPSGSDKLIITVHGRATADSPVRSVTNVTFNAIEAMRIAETNNGRGIVAIFYIDSPPAGGDLVVQLNDKIITVGVSMTAVSGTVSGAGPSANAQAISGTVTTTADGTLVVAGATNNDTTSPPIPDPDPPLTAVFASAVYANYCSGGAGYYVVPTAGGFNYSFDQGANPATVAAGFEPNAAPPAPAVSLSGNSVASNASPGTLVGTLSMVNTNGTFTYSLDTTGDYAYFDISSGTTNLRTAAWINKASFDISIVGTESGGGGLVVTNDFTITVDAIADARPTFVVSAEVQNGATDGTVVGTARTVESGATFSIISGRADLFYFEGSDLKVTNSADWGSIGTTNYVTLQAIVGSGTNQLVVAAGIVGSASSRGTVFIFM